MRRNVGNIDRGIRLLAGLALIAFAIPIGFPNTGWNWIGWIGVVPIINENDSVAVEELKTGFPRVADRLEQPTHAARVLLGQQLGRRHDGGLQLVLHREQRGEQRDDRLAAADVALQQAVHAAVAAHVGHDLARGAGLRHRLV